MAPPLIDQILDQAPNAVVSMDESGRVTYWNPRAQEMFGVSREDALGQRVAELIVPERLRAAHTAALDRFLANGTGPLIGRRVELDALRSDGTEFPVELTLSAVRDSDRWNFHAFVADISGRRETEQQRDLLVDELRVALQDSERRFQAVVGSFSDPVTIRDRQDRIIYANRAALQTLGFDSVEQLRVTPPADIMADYIVSGDDGRPVAMDDIPSVRILRGQHAEPLLIRTIHRETGAQRWQLLKSAPLLDSDGEIEATITVIENVTEQKRAERQNAFLADVSAALASSLDYEQTLRNVAQLAVPDVVDWCAVDLRDDDGDRRPVAVAHADLERLKLAEELRNYEQIQPESQRGDRAGVPHRATRAVSDDPRRDARPLGRRRAPPRSCCAKSGCDLSRSCR